MHSEAPPSSPALAAFLARFDAYCEAAGRQQGPVSLQLFGASDRVSEIRNTRSDVGVKRLAQAEAELSRLAAEAGITLPDAVEGTESETEPARPLQAGAA
ncbi:MAG TPA: hypothetical protein VEA80_06685 [Vitreimonas sp.]|uniref:hypothetical protein n=1 Tax=Vitreimonas sp. TaxID=3069702 RepID=UPI002D59933E|nr:hypothetical protein [Vitreimonas sp.]HYD87140.1 hypothetical protein [Vitreimonas sp.]